MGQAALTFDCAGTLIAVRWEPAKFAVECAEEAGARFHSVTHAQDAYSRLLNSRWSKYQELNLLRDRATCDRFWAELTHDWLEEVGESSGRLNEILEIARSRLYGDRCDQFSLFEDSIGALDWAKRQGFRLAALSNWDYSLHLVIDRLGIREYFDEVVASLEEGVEKPDPRLFQIALDRLGVAAAEATHIGDDRIDDWTGAKGAGLRAVLLDRSGGGGDHAISSLRELPEALGCRT